MQPIEYIPPEIPTLRKNSCWQPRAWIVVLCGGVLTLLLWSALALVSYLCPTPQQRIDRLFKAWCHAHYYNRAAEAQLNVEIAQLGPKNVPELCAALDRVGEDFLNVIGDRILKELERINDPRAVEGLARCVRGGGQNAAGALRLLLKLAKPRDQQNVRALLLETAGSRCQSCRIEAAIELARRQKERAIDGEDE
jgi:hypothetical protein